MLDREPEAGLLDEIGRQGIACIVYSPLAQGLLTDRYLHDDLPAGSRAATSSSLAQDRIDEHYRRLISGLAELAASRGQSIAQLALSWVLRDERITSAIIGASSVSQLEQNVQAAGAAPLEGSELERIEALLHERSSQ
jgi:L-glyceraldehyde 3-phosphate reductase